jgi:hypothetical protein
MKKENPILYSAYYKYAEQNRVRLINTGGIDKADLPVLPEPDEK